MAALHLDFDINVKRRRIAMTVWRERRYTGLSAEVARVPGRIEQAKARLARTTI